jgi:hypothetical protein
VVGVEDVVEEIEAAVIEVLVEEVVVAPWKPKSSVMAVPQHQIPM